MEQKVKIGLNPLHSQSHKLKPRITHNYTSFRYTIADHANPITGVRVSYLGILSVQPSDSGKYECVDNPTSVFGKDEVTLIVTTKDKGGCAWLKADTYITSTVFRQT